VYVLRNQPTLHPLDIVKCMVLWRRVSLETAERVEPPNLAFLRLLPFGCWRTAAIAFGNASIFACNAKPRACCAASLLEHGGRARPFPYPAYLKAQQRLCNHCDKARRCLMDRSRGVCAARAYAAASALCVMLNATQASTNISRAAFVCAVQKHVLA